MEKENNNLLGKLKYQMYIDGNTHFISSYVIINPFNEKIFSYEDKTNSINKREAVRKALLLGAKKLLDLPISDVDIFTSNNHIINIINNLKIKRPEMLQFYKYFHRIMEGINWELIKISTEQNKANCSYLPKAKPSIFKQKSVLVRISTNVIKRIKE